LFENSAYISLGRRTNTFERDLEFQP